MATFTRLKSGSWRVQVRRKGKYVNDTFLRRKDAAEWALDVERRIDRGESPTLRNCSDAKTFGDLVRLHRDDLQEVSKRIGRSKAASLAFLERKLGRLQLPEVDHKAHGAKAASSAATATDAATAVNDAMIRWERNSC